MQTFLPYPDFQKSASCLDDKRLGKQRVECLQILKCLQTGPEQLSINPSSKSFKYKDGMFRRNTPWYNHPAVQMWKFHEDWLKTYSLAICDEWIKRGYKDTVRAKIKSIATTYSPLPAWFCNKDFFVSHQSNLIRKKPEFYRPIFGSEVPDNLPYIWPA